MKLLAFIALMALFPFAAAEPAFIAHVKIYSNDSASLISIAAGDEEYYSYPDLPGAPYSVEIFSVNGSRYFSSGFEPLFESFFTTNEGGHVGIKAEYQEFFFILPLERNAERLVVAHRDKVLLDYPLKQVMCNADNVCSSYETISNCPSDCLKYPKTPKPAEKPFPFIETSLFLLFFAVFSVLLIRRLRRGKAREIY